MTDRRQCRLQALGTTRCVSLSVTLLNTPHGKCARDERSASSYSGSISVASLVAGIPCVGELHHAAHCCSGDVRWSDRRLPAITDTDRTQGVPQPRSGTTARLSPIRAFSHRADTRAPRATAGRARGYPQAGRTKQRKTASGWRRCILASSWWTTRYRAAPPLSQCMIVPHTLDLIL